MAVLGRGKTFSDKPGWALDPKTKLELKRRKETRELPSKFGGKTAEEMREKSGSRNIVTSENREEFMKKKLNLADKEKEVMVEDKPHAIYKSGTDEILSHHATQAEADAAYEKLGQKMADYAVGELPEKERKKYGY